MQRISAGADVTNNEPALSIRPGPKLVEFRVPLPIDIGRKPCPSIHVGGPAPRGVGAGEGGSRRVRGQPPAPETKAEPRRPLVRTRPPHPHAAHRGPRRERLAANPL